MAALEKQLPAEFIELRNLVLLSKQLNSVTGSSYYNPHILADMPFDELDNLAMVAQWQT